MASKRSRKAFHRAGRRPCGERARTRVGEISTAVSGVPTPETAVEILGWTARGGAHSFRSLAPCRRAASGPSGMASMRRVPAVAGPHGHPAAGADDHDRAGEVAEGPQRLVDHDAALPVGLDGEGGGDERLGRLLGDDAEGDAVVPLGEHGLDLVVGPQAEVAVERAEVGAAGQPGPERGRQDQPALVVDRVLEGPREEPRAGRARGAATAPPAACSAPASAPRGKGESLHFVGKYPTSLPRQGTPPRFPRSHPSVGAPERRSAPETGPGRRRNAAGRRSGGEVRQEGVDHRTRREAGADRRVGQRAGAVAVEAQQADRAGPGPTSCTPRTGTGRRPGCAAGSPPPPCARRGWSPRPPRPCRSTPAGRAARRPARPSCTTSGPTPRSASAARHASPTHSAARPTSSSHSGSPAGTITSTQAVVAGST